MNPYTKNKLITAIPIIILAWMMNKFVNSSILDTMISNGNEEIKEFVVKSFSWGICFGALIVIFIKYLAGVLKKSNN